MKPVCALLFALCIVSAVPAQQLYFPPLSGSAWESVTPASLGWCTDNIDSLYAYLQSRNTRAFIVLKDGRIVLEKYFGTFTGDSLWYWASAGKTVTSFLAGIARWEGAFRLQDSSSKFLGRGWTSLTPDKERLITVQHQLTMSGGLKDNVPDPYCTLPACLIYQADAGTRWAYHNAPYTLLDSVISKSTGSTFNAFFFSRLRNRAGMNGVFLPSGYNNVYYSSPRSMARFGLLMLNRGIWAADTIMKDTAYYRNSISTSQQYNLSYGYLWWLNGKATYMLPQSQIVFPGYLAPAAPADMFSALGKNGQILNVVPSRGLVMVRMGDAPDSSLEVPTVFNNEIWKRFNRVLCTVSAEEQARLPEQFSIGQNFPNPFNPSTTITFTLPVTAPTVLTVFDALGRRVGGEEYGVTPAGTYQYCFTAAGLASGVYVCRLLSGNRSAAIRMVLLR